MASLALPSFGRDELEVLSELMDEELFVDTDFGPAPASLGDGVAEVAEMGWMRMDEAMPDASLFVDGELPGDLEAGSTSVDDVWFAGALATVATRADLLLRLFVSVDNEESGMLSLRFFKHGAWRTVLIDTMLPCHGDGAPAFCKAASGVELWPSVVLKGYAKLHGSYGRLHGGDAGEALVDLTGGAVTREVLPKLTNGREDDEPRLAQVWALLKGTEAEGGLLALEVAERGAEGGDGLLGGRLYPLLECFEDARGLRLLRLRNPWGGAGWRGRLKVPSVLPEDSAPSASVEDLKAWGSPTFPQSAAAAARWLAAAAAGRSRRPRS